MNITDLLKKENCYISFSNGDASRRLFYEEWGSTKGWKVIEKKFRAKKWRTLISQVDEEYAVRTLLADSYKDLM